MNSAAEYAAPGTGDGELTAAQALALCKHRWEQLGLAATDVEEMLDELGGHLADAADRGRRPAAVLGPRPEDFIREWALARTTPRERWLRRISMVAAAAVGLLLVSHLWQATSTAKITPGYLAYGVGFCAIQLFWRPKGRPLTAARLWLACTVLLVPVIGLHLVFRDAVLFSVPLWMTMTAAALAAVAIAVDVRDRRGGSEKRADAG